MGVWATVWPPRTDSSQGQTYSTDPNGIRVATAAEQRGFLDEPCHGSFVPLLCHPEQQLVSEAKGSRQHHKLDPQTETTSAVYMTSSSALMRHAIAARQALLCYLIHSSGTGQPWWLGVIVNKLM